MVERQPVLTAVTHLVLVLGILVVAFPIYVTFVASTHPLEDVVRAPMPLRPGDRLAENYAAALAEGLRTVGGLPVGRMLANSLVMALGIAVGKIAISELFDAARIDGAGPVRFFTDILLPISRTTLAALFVILLISGWNQYRWPLLVTTDESMYTIVVSIPRMTSVAEAQVEWQRVMASTVLALLPPVAVVVVMQRWFVKGLVETEK